MKNQLSASAVIVPPYLHSLFSELREQSGFEVLHVSRQLQGVDHDTMMRKFELLSLNDQSGSAIDSVRIVVRNPDGLELTCTWGVFDEDLSSADADNLTKTCLQPTSLTASHADITPVVASLAAAGFELVWPSAMHDFSIRFIRGKAMAGKMRLGIHANLDFSAYAAGLGHAKRAR